MVPPLHVPPEQPHVPSLPHFMLQPPQLFGSVMTSTHCPPQSTLPPVHAALQTPPEHVVPAPQSASEQHALHIVWLQHLVPAPQPACAQLMPSGAQVSPVQPSPSEQSESSQHTRQS